MCMTNCLRIVRTLAMALLIALIVPLPACDPALLTPEQRVIVTGTTDVGQLTLTVDPTATELTSAPVTFSYEVRSVTVGGAGFQGTISLALSGLTPEVQLAEALSPSSFPVMGGGRFTGTFQL